MTDTIDLVNWNWFLPHSWANSSLLFPIFFVSVEAKTHLSRINLTVARDRDRLIIATFLILVAILGKVITGFAVLGQPDLNKITIGVGIIPRGGDWYLPGWVRPVEDYPKQPKPQLSRS
jgi:hypothetical protein